MCDYLASFKSTQDVLRAEQLLIRRKIPFETVPNAQYKSQGCGIGIVFSAEHLDSVRLLAEENDLIISLVQIENSIPS